ncbi:MAG: hypothetical protein M3Q60_19190 [Actinomycetota bacterium]|nr:hypothetical protein [Actinomycetota bacterium]
MKRQDKQRAGEVVPFPGVTSGHRDGWRWEPATRLPSKWRRKDLRYDDAQPSMLGKGVA